MAPEPALGKRKPKENQFIFDLGRRGRKTGLTVADSGVRDENGLEPMDNIFSSPQKSVKNNKVNGYSKNANGTISSEEDMDLESIIPEPTAVLTERQQRSGMRLPPPRSKSPIKTFLQSPARRNPSMGLFTSPSRRSPLESRLPSVSASVRRKLDFSNDSLDANVSESSATNGSSQKRTNNNSKTASTKLINGTRIASQSRVYSSDDVGEEYRDDTAQTENDIGMENDEDSFQMVDAGDDGQLDPRAEELEEDSEPEPEPEPLPAKRGKGRPKNKQQETKEKPVKTGRRTRPRESASLMEETEEVEQRPAKKARRSLDGPVPVAEAGTKPKSKSSKITTAAKESKPKAPAQKPKLASIAEAESPEIQRGPPMPRNNRGLMILRRETPMDGTGFKQTRSGRNSVKPVAYWKNEKIEYSEEEAEDSNGRFLLPRIKGVVRADEIEQQLPKKASHKLGKTKSKKRPAIELDDDEREPWEDDPGIVIKKVKVWDPNNLIEAGTEDEEVEVAISSAAIITRDVGEDASFKFAKTLTMPFFGSGVVDIPSGGAKRSKCSRRMQLAFFVFYGRVEVEINAEKFRIGKGGFWQVPRGNFYAINNDYGKPARLFFAQGCEVEVEVGEEQEEEDAESE